MSKLPDDAGTDEEVVDASGTVTARMPYPYHELSTDGELLTVNEAWLDLVGADRSAVDGSSFGDFLTASSSERFENWLLGLSVDQQLSKIDLDLRGAEGDPIPISLRGRIAVDDDGSVGRIHCQFHERAVSADQQEITADDVLEAVPHPLYVLDVADYTVLEANSLATAQPGNTCYEVTHDRDEPCHEGDGVTFPCPLRQVIESGEPTTVEHTHYDGDGNERVHEVHAAPIFDEDGTVVQMVESIIDVTERIEYERQLRDQRDDLDVLNQVLRHDIRNDLQLVVSHAELLSDRTDDDSIETILERARHAVELTKTAREMSESLLTSDEPAEPKRLRDALESEIQGLRSSYPDAEIAVDGEIPSVSVLADEMLSSVFRNLLKNAIQHNNSTVPAVTVSVERRDDTVTVQVADNGPGIPDRQKEEIFGKGEKGLKSAGTGIGLYLVQTLVSKYGGTISVGDNDPKGAVFTVQLPVA
jgi:PAS domain S-box-containing protein